VHYLNILILLYESPKLADAWVIMVHHKHILDPLPHRSVRVVSSCQLPPFAAAAANYKQCVGIPNCHLCTYWYCFSWPAIPLLCMPHITRVNVQQHYNYSNTTQPPHALMLAFALKRYIYVAQNYCYNPVIWSLIMDMHHSIFDSVCCHTLQLPLHIISNAHLFPIATCVPNRFFFLGNNFIALHVSTFFR
jgi:hypothetical protein